MSDVPVILVGNKTDQIGDRMVSVEEGQRRFRELSCACFHEISVRESVDQVRKCLEKHLLQCMSQKLNSIHSSYRCSLYFETFSVFGASSVNSPNSNVPQVMFKTKL